MRRNQSIILVLIMTLAVIMLVLLPGPGLGYLINQAYYQAGMLSGRQDIDVVVQEGTLTDAQLESITWIGEILDFAPTVGLKCAGQYQTIQPNWEHSVHVVSATPPLSFDGITWWFPIVGRVPYIGYFEQPKAQALEKNLRDKGLDVYRREAGAYSTLGWFKDPVLPHMLEWSKAQLANTLLHELTHGTIWIPGSVGFNESFATFVGEEASLRLLTAHYGPDSPELKQMHAHIRDKKKYRDTLHGVFLELQSLYDDDTLSEEEKHLQKSRIIQSLPARIDALALNRPKIFLEALHRHPMNNARLMEFKTYNDSKDEFSSILKALGGHLPSFLTRISEIVREHSDPILGISEEAAMHASTHGFE